MKKIEAAKIFVNQAGTWFRVRVVPNGGKYGLEDRLVHDSEDPLIEYYYQGSTEEERNRIRRVHGERGWFVSRYFLSTLKEGDWTAGGALCLRGGDSRMVVDESIVRESIALASKGENNG